MHQRGIKRATCTWRATYEEWFCLCYNKRMADAQAIVVVDTTWAFRNLSRLRTCTSTPYI